MDQARKGYLRYPDFAVFLKKILPSLSPEGKRCIVSYLYSLDLDHKGFISFRQLMRYMSRAPGVGVTPPSYVPPTTPSGPSASMTRGSLTGSSSIRATPGRDINASVDGGRTPWILRELTAGREVYLLDVKSGRVYSNAMGHDWPELVGTWDGVEITFMEKSAAGKIVWLQWQGASSLISSTLSYVSVSKPFNTLRQPLPVT